MRRLLLLMFGVPWFVVGGCFIDEHCSGDAECGLGNICDPETHACRPGCRDDSQCPGGLRCFGTKCVCINDNDCDGGRICVDQSCQNGCRGPTDCPAGQVCIDNRCVPISGDGDADVDADADADADMDSDVDFETECPDDMVPMLGFCIDIHEASRQDATETSAGVDDSIATSRLGVRPWTNMTRSGAAAACEAAGKRLCTAAEWISSCRGPDDTDYPYGNEYDPETCNGIDTFGRGNQRPLPTGALFECVNDYGVYDISGNVWEIDEDYPGWVHGGAYNCIDSMSLHQCSYNQDFGTAPRANVGFRCCRDGL